MRALDDIGLPASISVNLPVLCARDPGGCRASSTAVQPLRPTRRRKWLGTIQFVLTSVLVLSSLSAHRAFTQGSARITPGRMPAGTTATARSNTAQATLVITATIMPMGVVANARPAVSSGDVLINLPSNHLQSEETVEWRMMPGRSDAALRTTTIVTQ